MDAKNQEVAGLIMVPPDLMLDVEGKLEEEIDQALFNLGIAEEARLLIGSAIGNAIMLFWYGRLDTTIISEMKKAIAFKNSNNLLDIAERYKRECSDTLFYSGWQIEELKNIKK